jgi:hypothetical protein
MVGLKVFWLRKYLSLNDEVVETMIEQRHVIMARVNNILKKRISCRNDALANSL